jgi:hypothetical protein
MKEQIKLNIDLKNTRPVTLDENHVFVEGVILRKVSKFITGTSEDGIVPIPVFYNPTTGKILIETLPKELREEYASYQNESIESTEN